MAVLAENGRNKLWFGTVNQMEWLPTPNRGADVSPEGWFAGGPLLSGGGYQLHSYNSHKNYVFEWPSSSSRQAAQKMKSYFDGTFGRGLLYFVDPLIYDTNVLPALWADPSMAVGGEASSLVPGVTPSALPAAGSSFGLPVNSAFYDLSGTGLTDTAQLDDSNSVFIPIPEGFVGAVSAFYEQTGSGGVYFTDVTRGGNLGATTAVSPSTEDAPFTTVTNPGSFGVRLWVGKTASGDASVTLRGMMIRFVTPQDAQLGNFGDMQWYGGQGHSGCRFSAIPTYINNTGTNGGQVGYAASFREVGSWVNV